MKTPRFISTLIIALFATIASGQVPPLINYQGRVVVGTTNFDGTGQFKFALVNNNGTVSFWSNDGTSSAGSQPTASVNLSVVRGLYAVLLGDTTVAGMPTALPITVFTNGDVRLRVWFNDGVTGFQQFTPDQRLAAVGYAMMGANVPDGAITSNKLANGAVTAAKIADGSVTGSKIADGAITSSKLSPNTVTSSNIADTIALGQTNVNGRLDVYRTTAGTPSISLIGNGSQISTYGSDGLEQIRLWGTGFGELILHNNLSNNATAVTLTAQGSTGGRLTLNNTNGSSRAVLEGENTGGLLTLYTADGNTGAILYGNEGAGSGALSLRNTNGSPRFRAYGGPADGRLELLSQQGATTLIAEGGEGSSGSQILLYQSNGVQTLQFDAENGVNGGGYIALYAGDGGASIIGTATTTSGGQLAVYGADAGNAVVANANTQGGQLLVYEEDGTLTTAIHNVSDAGVVSVRNSAGVETGYLWGRNVAGQAGGQLGLKNSAGVQTIWIDGDSGGDGKVTTQVLQITGGSDLSENFDIRSYHQPLQPGMIVCIDPKNPGQLVTSTKAYDKTVAGVMSGAGGVKPGMLMGQKGTAADGAHPVALTGRVYCMVDADKGAIEPGDLITTSDTPGHGMKVKKHDKAQGAIVGKAMTAMQKGKGLVLVLVSLQ